VHLGESHGAEEYAYDVERCEVYPESVGNLAETHDLAYCVLVNPITALPAIPLLAGCELDAIGEGTVAVIAGYGLASAEGNFGRKRYAFTRLASDVRADGTVRVGDAGANGCDGDSGGPALVQLADGSWRVIGVLSTAPPCGEGAGVYRTLADRIGWLEERSGFDLTPCWDAGGTWTDGAACDGFDRDPRVTDDAMGNAPTWATLCVEPGMTPSMMCEASAGDDASSSEGASSGDGTSSSSSSSGGAEREASAASGCGCNQRGGRETPLLAAALWIARRRRVSDRGRNNPRRRNR
jgi:hypothetical protein